MSGYAHEPRRHRSLSPREHERHRKDTHRRRSPPQDDRDVAVLLPYRQSTLRKRDLAAYKNLFADYLDIHKRLSLIDLPNDEVKGRWKSFIHKWNAGKLAEGWYDPARLAKSQQYPIEQMHVLSKESGRSKPIGTQPESEDEDEYGPGLPSGDPLGRVQGPTIPRLHDLQYKRELENENRQLIAEQRQDERRHEKKTQKERLDELVPRADPGSRERQREKKQDATMTNRAFAEAKDAGSLEVADSVLMGEDGLDAYKAKKRAAERQKNERELRKEEVLRARAAEREERFAEHRQKEEKTMETLRALARQRFG